MSLPTDLADDALLALLPSRVAELIDVVGLAAALKLVNLRGGRRLEVPKRAKPEHWLVEHIGLDAFAKLVAYYNGERIEIDRCAKLLETIEQQALVADIHNGLSTAQLAEKYSYTERNIRYLKKRVKTAQPSANLDWITDLL